MSLLSYYMRNTSFRNSSQWSSAGTEKYLLVFLIFLTIYIISTHILYNFVVHSFDGVTTRSRRGSTVQPIAHSTHVLLSG
jgi:hypothetical protein